MSAHSNFAELFRVGRNAASTGRAISNSAPQLRLASRPRRKLRWGLASLFALVAGVTLFFNLGGVHTLGSHEAYAVVPAREMMRTGDWTVPCFAGIPRLTKPPLAYWELASLGTVFGGLDEGLARMPQAVAALLLALLMGVWGARWYGTAAGWAAAFVQVTALYVLTYGRKVDVDMTVWLFITAALFLIAHQPPDESRGRSFLRWAGIGALIAVSWLGKFHYGLVMIVAPTVVYFVLQKRPSHIIRFLNPFGLMLIAAAVLVWPWLVLQRLPATWDLWYAETVGRAIGRKGFDPVWYYVPVVLTAMLPWTPFAFAAMPRSWRRAWKEGNAHERFLWVWFLSQFVIVSAQPNKHVHYVYSALPPLTLLAAQALPGCLRRLQNGSAWVGKCPALLVTLCVVPAMAVAGIVLARRWPQIAGPVAATTAIIGAGVPLGAWLAAFGRYRPAGLAGVATFLGSFVVIHGWVLPKLDNRLATALFAQESREMAGAKTTVVTYRLGQHSSTYYLGSPTRRVELLDDLRQLVRKNGRVFVMTMQPFSPELESFPHQRIVRRMRRDPEIPPPRHAPFVLHEIRSEEFAKRMTQQRVATASTNRASDGRN
jgi:4-amino-4-deoxy-L-arabinose transferase-like glycosyltransferase